MRFKFVVKTYCPLEGGGADFFYLGDGGGGLPKVFKKLFKEIM